VGNKGKEGRDREILASFKNISLALFLLLFLFHATISLLIGHSLSLTAIFSLTATLSFTSSTSKSFGGEYQVGEQFDLRFSFVANLFKVKIHPFITVELFDD